MVFRIREGVPGSRIPVIGAGINPIGADHFPPAAGVEEEARGLAVDRVVDHTHDVAGP